MATAGLLDPTLEEKLRKAAPDEFVSALVYLTGQVDASGTSAMMDAERLTLRHRHESVVTALQDMAAATQGNLLAHLEARKAAGAVGDFHAFWIGVFVPLPAIDDEPFARLFREKVFDLLLRNGRIDERIVRQMRGWRHCGFSVDRSVRLARVTRRASSVWRATSSVARSASPG